MPALSCRLKWQGVLRAKEEMRTNTYLTLIVLCAALTGCRDPYHSYQDDDETSSGTDAALEGDGDGDTADSQASGTTDWTSDTSSTGDGDGDGDGDAETTGDGDGDGDGELVCTATAQLCGDGYDACCEGTTCEVQGPQGNYPPKCVDPLACTPPNAGCNWLLPDPLCCAGYWCDSNYNLCKPI